MKNRGGLAKEPIPYGAHVLLRGNDVRVTDHAIANGRARVVTFFPNSGGCYLPGEWVSVDLLDDIGDRDIHSLAAGPIMDPLGIYLPAGKLTERGYQERLDLQFAEACLVRERRR